METTLRTMQGSFSDVCSDDHVLAVMGTDGDTKHIWNKTNEDEKAAAEVLFESLLDKGYNAYTVEKDGTRGEGPIREFNGDEERYIFVPQMQGG